MTGQKTDGSRRCSAPACDRPFHSSWAQAGPHRGRDLCKLHYDRLYRGHDIGPAEPQLHYPDSAASRTVDQAPSCAVTPCPDPAKTRGMCTKHYQRWKKHGDPNVVKTRRVNEGGCTVTLRSGDACPEPSYVRQMCSAHYQRWKTHGDPLHEVAKVNASPECSEPGCTKKPKSRGLCSACYERQRVNKQSSNAL